MPRGTVCCRCPGTGVCVYAIVGRRGSWSLPGSATLRDGCARNDADRACVAKVPYSSATAGWRRTSMAAPFGTQPCQLKAGAAPACMPKACTCARGVCVRGGGGGTAWSLQGNVHQHPSDIIACCRVLHPGTPTHRAHPVPRVYQGSRPVAERLSKPSVDVYFLISPAHPHVLVRPFGVRRTCR